MRKTAFVAVLSFLALSCTPVQPTPVPSGGTTTIVNVNVGNGAPSSPTPGASPGGGQIVRAVNVSEFGERTTDACSNPAETFPRETRVGCVSDVTCNPRDAQGKVIFNEAVVSLVYFKQLGGTGAGIFSQDDANGFNGVVACRSAGAVVLDCAVRDTATGAVVSMDSPASFTCVS